MGNLAHGQRLPETHVHKRRAQRLRVAEKRERNAQPRITTAMNGKAVPTEYNPK
jgi:hypothetical protein